jgi:hypothetical protein
VYLLTLFLSPASTASKNNPANTQANGKPIQSSPQPAASGNTKDKAAEERKLEEMRQKLLKSMAERRLAKEKQEQAQKKRQSPPAGRKRSAESNDSPNRPVKRIASAPSGGLTIKGAAGAQAKPQQVTSAGRTPVDLLNRHLQGGMGHQDSVVSRGRGIRNTPPAVAPANTMIGRPTNRAAPEFKKSGLSIAGRATQNTLRQTQTSSPIQKRLSTNTVSINNRLGKNHQDPQQQQQQQQQQNRQNRPWQRKAQRQGAH